jgi:hypothetical protein
MAPLTCATRLLSVKSLMGSPNPSAGVNSWNSAITWAWNMSLKVELQWEQLPGSSGSSKIRVFDVLRFSY